MNHVRSANIKKYRVSCWRTNYGYYDVEAKDEKEAEEKAYQHLWNGVEMDGTRDTDADTAEIQELSRNGKYPYEN